jgi:hypothetical protein
MVFYLLTTYKSEVFSIDKHVLCLFSVQKLLYFGCWERSRLNLFDFLTQSFRFSPPGKCDRMRMACKRLWELFTSEKRLYTFVCEVIICIRQGPFTLAIFAAISSAIFVFWWMWRSGWVINAQMKEHVLRTFITHPLVLIQQKKNIAQEIAAQIASVNGPSETQNRWQNC